MPTAANGGEARAENNNNTTSSQNSNSKQTTTAPTIATTPFRLTSTTNSAHHLIRPRPSHSLSAVTSSYLNNSNILASNSSGRASVSTITSSPSSAFSSSYYSSKARTTSGLVMETPAPYPASNSGNLVNHVSSSVSTPRPASRLSTGASSSASSASPPGNNGQSLHILTAVEHAAVAVVPANNHSTEASSTNAGTNNCQNQGGQQQNDNSFIDQALDLPTFDKADDVSDIVLDVEGQKLYAHRIMLVLVSPVFRAMLTTGDFIERQQSVISFKDKKHDELLEFLQAIYPPWKPVSSANVRTLLKFADEYRVDGLLRRCEDFLLALKMARDTQEQRLWAYDQGQPFCRVNELLGLANTFNLERLSRALVDYLSPRPLAWQMDGPDFFAYSGPELENRILNKALTTALTLIDRNRYCDTVKELLHGHKVYFE